jgi:hypothetical protein
MKWWKQTSVHNYHVLRISWRIYRCYIIILKKINTREKKNSISYTHTTYRKKRIYE